MFLFLHYAVGIHLKFPNTYHTTIHNIFHNICGIPTLINNRILTFSLSWAQWHYRFCWEPFLSDLSLESGASALLVTPENTQFDAKVTAYIVPKTRWLRWFKALKLKENAGIDQCPTAWHESSLIHLRREITKEPHSTCRFHHEDYFQRWSK